MSVHWVRAPSPLPISTVQGFGCVLKVVYREFPFIWLRIDLWPYYINLDRTSSSWS